MTESGGNGSLVRAWARSRSLRDVEENNRLRRGLTAGAASAGSASAAPRCARDRATRPRPAMAAAPLAQCGRHVRRPARRGRTGSRPQPALQGARRPQRPAAVRRLPRAVRPECRRQAAARCSSARATTIQRPSMISAGASRDRAGEDQRIAEAEFLDRNSEADRQQARQNKANPGDQQAQSSSNSPPAPRPKCAQAANATIPSYCVHRQPAIAEPVPRKSCRSAGNPVQTARFTVVRRRIRIFTHLPYVCHIAALHQGNYATIPNYLERELRYMDAGE